MFENTNTNMSANKVNEAMDTNSQVKVKNLSQAEQLWAQHQSKPGLISSLKWFYHTTVGDSHRELLKPIAWYNQLYWWSYTFQSDRRHYLVQPRPLSLKRLAGIIKPNLQSPIFIVGAPRSGTTFLGNSIASIPEISYHFEPVATKAATRYVYNQLWNENKSRRFYQFFYAWLMRIHGDGDLRFAEKTPQISFIIPFLAKVFPQAKFIHIIRDGRDVALSLAAKPWHQSTPSSVRDPDGYLCGPSARFWVEPQRVEEFETTTDLHRCIWIWRRHVEAVLQAKENLADEAYHELKYENLVRNPLQEANKITEFLNISHPNARKIFQNAVTSNIKTDSVGRWKEFLSPEQLEQLNQETTSLMERLKYSN